MNIHAVTPYRVDRNLGKAYNTVFSMIPDDDWLIITDYDVLFLLPDTIKHIHGYVAQYPDTGMFVCWANRTYYSNAQLFGGPVSTPDEVSKTNNIDGFISQAQALANERLYQVTEINRTISGFLMVISKKTWQEQHFTEDMKCLGVDSLYSQQLLNRGRKILRMDGILVWHTYRLTQGIKNTLHLL